MMFLLWFVKYFSSAILFRPWFSFCEALRTTKEKTPQKPPATQANIKEDLKSVALTRTKVNSPRKVEKSVSNK